MLARIQVADCVMGMRCGQSKEQPEVTGYSGTIGKVDEKIVLADGN